MTSRLGSPEHAPVAGRERDAIGRDLQARLAELIDLSLIVAGVLSVAFASCACQRLEGVRLCSHRNVRIGGTAASRAAEA
jgi:hypothetical protein